MTRILVTTGLFHEFQKSLFWERLSEKACSGDRCSDRESQNAGPVEAGFSFWSTQWIESVLFLSSLFFSGPQYRLEKQSEPNVAVDLECTLERQSTLEFCLVRENSEFNRSNLHIMYCPCIPLFDQIDTALYLCNVS